MAISHVITNCYEVAPVAYTRNTLKIEGLKDLEVALLDLSRSTSGNILKRAVGVAGAAIAERAAELAPKDRPLLALEIKVAKPKITNAGKAAFAQAMRETGDRAIAAAAARAANREAGGKGRSAVTHVGPTKRAGHGMLQEFGTAHHKAQPFMRPSWDELGAKAADIIRDEIKVGIDAAQKRAERKAARLAAKIASGQS